METPIQKIKGHIHDRLIAAKELDEPTRYLEGLMLIADQLLEDERKLIILAYEDGVSEGSNHYSNALSAIDYYNETFDIEHD